MSYKILNQNERKAVWALLDPKRIGSGKEMISQVADELGLKPKTIIRYLANPDFTEVITNISAGLKIAGRGIEASDASVADVATE